MEYIIIIHTCKYYNASKRKCVIVQYANDHLSINLDCPLATFILLQTRFN